MTVEILQGDCREIVQTMQENSVDCVVTSPPFWGLRDYGWEGQIGLEPTVQEYVATITEVFRNVRRVLSVRGTLWLNLGDTYACSGGSHRGHNISNRKRNAEPLPAHQPNRKLKPSGLKHKDMIGIPWRVAFALQEDGWYLRSEIVWHKTNALPEGVTDRPFRDHEQIFLLSKSPTYHYDRVAVMQPTTGGAHRRGKGTHKKCPEPGSGVRWNTDWSSSVREIVDEKNLRTVWSIAVSPGAEGHYATFPERLVVPCVLAGCPQGGVVLDPFAGSGTVGRVAEALGRNAILIEGSPEYCETARKRTAQLGLLTGATC